MGIDNLKPHLIRFDCELRNSLFPVLIFDRDNTLFDDQGSSNLISGFKWRTGITSLLRQLKERSIAIAIASNQPRVGEGVCTLAELDEFNQYSVSQIQLESECSVLAIACCTHQKNLGCNCRKPNTGLLECIATLDPFMKIIGFVGDSEVDFEAAKNYGIPGFDINHIVGDQAKTRCQEQFWSLVKQCT
jgi:histidinol-phosphate phosphatase family protein